MSGYSHDGGAGAQLPLSTSIVYLFAAYVMIMQFDATLWMIAFIGASLAFSYWFMTRSEKKQKDWEQHHPEEAKKESFAEQLKKSSSSNSEQKSF